MKKKGKPNYKLKPRKQKGCAPIIEISWYEDGKRKAKSTGTNDWTEAADFLQDFIRSQENPNVTRHSEYEISKLLSEYFAEHGVHVADPDRIRYCIKALNGFWGDKTLSNVTPVTCREYIDWREVGHATIRRELGTLKAAIRHAFRERRIDQDVHIGLPPKPDVEDKWLTDEQFEAILGECEHLPDLWRYCLIRRYTGQRSVAVLDLRWDDIDLDARIIRWGDGVGNKRRARRQRLASDRLYGILKLGKDYTPRPKVLKYIPHPPPIQPVFYPSVELPMRSPRRVEHDVNKVIRYTSEGIKSVFKRAAVRAGLPMVSPSWLRHTCITRLIQDGATLSQVSEFVGVSTAVIERTYWHHSPHHMTELPME